MRTQSTRFGAFALGFVSMFSGCLAETEYGTGDGAFEVTYRCDLRGECGEAFEGCIESGRNACEACIAIGGIYCQQYCRYRYECSDRHCRADDPCWSETWDADRGDANPGIRAACDEAVEHFAACGMTVWEEGSCEVFAHTARPAIERTFRCIARAACGEEAECAGLPPDPDTADVVCDAVAECGTWEVCNDREAFAANVGWLRDDVKDALLGCMAFSDCETRFGCLSGWRIGLDPSY